MKIQLSDHFSYSRLLRFTLPSIVMMIFTSIYGVVDGFFVSNYAGKTPFAAVNLIMPLLMILGCIGFMFGTGGAALVAMKMGEGENGAANRIFSMNVWVSAGMAVVIAAFGILFLRPLARLMGAEGRMLDDCVVYGRIVLAALPFYVLQYEFQCLFATAEKPKLGLFVTVAAGVTNMVLDAVFVAVFSWGLVGAAAATAFSQLVGGVLPLIYFGRKNSSRLRLGRLHFDGRALRKTLTNGSSEFMSNVSMSLVGMLYNLELLHYAGDDGVAAYGVMMYVSMIFSAAFIGYSIGIAPVIGFHNGAGNHTELRGLLRKSVLLLTICGLAMLGAAEALASPLARMFVGYSEALTEMTVHGFQIFSLSFFFMGFAIFASGFFTALNDGLTSALISFLRTLVFQTAAVVGLSLLLGLDGIWYSVVVSEAAAVAFSSLFLGMKRKKYHY